MVRECVASLLLLTAPGCSWLLDFSDNAIPGDAAFPGPDSAFDQAECDYKEPNDSVATAAAIQLADMAGAAIGPAAICPGVTEDHDFYKLTVDAATARLEIRLAYVYGAARDLDLRLDDEAGGEIAVSRGFSDEELLRCPGDSPACPALPAGDYVIEVFPAVTGAVNRYTIAITTAAAPSP
jgi:hypothetical protein